MVMVALLSWWVNIFSNGQFVHGGHFETRERCLIARENLMRSYRAIGYPNLRGFCIWHNQRSESNADATVGQG